MDAGPSRRPSVGSRQGSYESDSDMDDESPAASLSTAGGAARDKKRKRERACDHCRSRKVKCDGFEKHDRVCTLCRGQSRPCTYVSKANKRKNKPRVPAKTEPGQPSMPAITRHDGPSPVGREPAEIDKAAMAHEMLEFRSHTNLSEAGGTPDSPANVPSAAKPARVWMGNSSAFSSVGDAFRLAAANGFAGPPQPKAESANETRSKFGFQPVWETEEYSDLLGTDFWPPDDLASALIELYFNGCNLIFPLFREADFKKRFRRKDFLADRGFANVCLMMFAVAASHGSFDSRTFAPNFSADPYGPPTHGRQSAGWTYYYQATRRPRRHTKSADIADMQFAVLTCFFLAHCSNPLVCWSIIGDGVIYAYEQGAHRGGLGDDAVENDLSRRAFWCLFLLDAQMSAGTGRAPHVAPSTFDAPLPLQVPGSSSKEDLTAFHHCIKLSHLVRTTASSLYGIDSRSKSKNWIVQQMAALNAEVDIITSNLPESLRWTPHHSQQDPYLAQKAAITQLQLSSTVMLINRPALPNWRSPKTPPISATSFDLAVAAAHKGALVFLDHTLDVKGPPVFLIRCQEAAATLAMALFGGRQAGMVVDEPALTKGLQDCWRSMALTRDFWATAAASIGWMHALLEMKGEVPEPLPPLFGPGPPAAASGSSAGLYPAQAFYSVPPHTGAPLPPSTAADALGSDGFDYSAMYQQFSLEGLGFGMGMDDGFAFDFELAQGGEPPV